MGEVANPNKYKGDRLCMILRLGSSLRPTSTSNPYGSEGPTYRPPLILCWSKPPGASAAMNG
jgi:hypothetical protein